MLIGKSVIKSFDCLYFNKEVDLVESGGTELVEYVFTELYLVLSSSLQILKSGVHLIPSQFD
jgi:hypothetical protein